MLLKGALLKPSEKGERRATAPRSNGAARSIAKGSRYEILKDKIKTWWEDRFRVGEYLKEIKDGKLFKPEYATFEEFSEGEFGIKQAYAYRLIEASDLKSSLGNSTIVENLKRPAHAIALAAVPEAQREKVLTKVVDQGPVTAKAITETAARITRPTPAPTPKPTAKVESEKHLDKTGYPIPDSIWEDWQRAEGFSEHLRGLSRLKKIVSDGLDEGDVIFRELNNGAVSMLKNIYGELKCVIPYAVCSTCSGRTRSKCTLCKGRGFLSEFAWNQFVPVKIRDIRKKLSETK